MSIEIRESHLEDSMSLADLFSAHLDEQCAMDKANIRQLAFNPRDFIEAMLNPKLNKFLAAWDGGRMIGFIRLGILYGEGLLPLDKRVNRLRSSYLRRLPVSLLKRLQNSVGGIIARIERLGTPFSMLQPQTVGYIADLYIIKEYRHKGTGKLLVEQAMDWFRQMGVEAVELNVLNSNEAGRAFWKSLGFKDRRILARKEQKIRTT